MVTPVKVEEITYGTEHHLKVRELLGEPVGYHLHSIDASVYLTPYFRTYVLTSNKVVQVVQKVFSNLYIIFENEEAYREYQRESHKYDIDPETGRPFKR
jgi:hypothetical protein